MNERGSDRMDTYTVWYTKSEYGYIKVNANSSEEAASKADELIELEKDKIHWTMCTECSQNGVYKMLYGE